MCQRPIRKLARAYHHQQQKVDYLELQYLISIQNITLIKIMRFALLNTPIMSLLLLQLLSVCHSCLNPSESTGNCTQCLPTQVLIESNCYDKMRGCMAYKIVNKTLLCTTCQLGYVSLADKCERKAVVDSQLGTSPDQTNIPPVLIENPGNLNSTSIMVNGSNPIINETEQNIRNTTKLLPVFPDLKIFTIPFPTNLSRISIFSPPRKTMLPSLPSAAEKIVATRYPNLQNSKPVQLGVDSESKNTQYFNQDKLWIMYEEGTILLLEKSRKVELWRRDRNEETDYTITELFRNRNFERQVAKMKSDLSSKMPEVSSSLAINYNLKLPNNRTISLNMDMSTGQIQCLPNSEGFQQCSQALAKLSEMPRFNQYLKYSYSQFLENISIVNVPETVTAAQMYRNETNQTSFDFVFRVVYSGGPALTDQEYSLFRYNSARNTTQVLGYFIQNNNVLSFLKNSIKELNSTIPTHSGNKVVNSELTYNANATSTSVGDSSLSVAEILRRPVLGSQFKNMSKLDNNSASLTAASQNASVPQGSERRQNTIPKLEDKRLKVSAIKSEADLINYLLKTQFGKTLSSGYKITFFGNQSATTTQIYKAQIVTTTSVHSLTLTQNLENNQLKVAQQVENNYSCLGLGSDSVGAKIDSYLRKAYPLLKNYGRTITQFRLEGDGEKYYLVYVNEQKRRIVFEGSRKKDVPNYVISRNEVHDQGYCFERKNLENIGFNLSQFNERSFEEESKHSYLMPYKSALAEVVNKYRSYIYNSTVQSILSNGSHAKIYITNRFATFEYRAKLQQASRGEFTLIQQKYGPQILPRGFYKDRLLSPNDAEYEAFKLMEDSLIKKYKVYFGGGNLEMFAQKKTGQQSFDIAFKTVLGYFCLVASPVGRDSISVTPLRKALQLEQDKVPICKESEILELRDRKCYQRIGGCYRQIGNICIMCQPELILQAGRKECRKSCTW